MLVKLLNLNSITLKNEHNWTTLIITMNIIIIIIIFIIINIGNKNYNNKRNNWYKIYNNNYLNKTLFIKLKVIKIIILLNYTHYKLKEKF